MNARFTKEGLGWGAGNGSDRSGDNEIRTEGTEDIAARGAIEATAGTWRTARLKAIIVVSSTCPVGESGRPPAL